MTVYVGEMAYDTEAELVCGLSRPAEENGSDSENGTRLSPEIELYLIDQQKDTLDNQVQGTRDEYPAAAELVGGAEFAVSDSVGEAGHFALAYSGKTRNSAYIETGILPTLRSRKPKTRIVSRFCRRSGFYRRGIGHSRTGSPDCRPADPSNSRTGAADLGS